MLLIKILLGVVIVCFLLVIKLLKDIYKKIQDDSIVDNTHGHIIEVKKFIPGVANHLSKIEYSSTKILEILEKKN